MHKYGVIYKIINNINGKIYIGQTIQKDPFKRINRHFKKCKSIDLVYKAFLKYGKEAFTIEIICSTSNLNDLNYLEKFFIEYYNSLNPRGYNLKLGGEQGGKCSDEIKQKIREKSKEYYSKHDHPFKGKKFSKEHIANLSKVRRGFDSKARQLVREKSHEKMRIKIKAINIITNDELIFNSLEECAKTLKLQACNVSRVLNGKQNRTQHKGYKFIRINVDK